jgi:CRP/FNR family cyclic AMP-dependent transcriptional regulator
MAITPDAIASAAADFHRRCSEDHGGDHQLHLPDWTLDDWRALFANAAAVALANGEAVIRQGDADRALYFVLSGTLEVSPAAARGGALGGVARQHAGSIVGEIAFFDGRGRSAAVWATEVTQLLRLALDGFRSFAEERPRRAQEFLFALGALIASRLRRSEARGDRFPY